MEHYGFIVEQLARLTLPGRLTVVHAMDVPIGDGVLFDFPGEESSTTVRWARPRAIVRILTASGGFQTKCRAMY